jgi:regulator of protease activity HflC (stomatin/prohibitin superfamily)
MNGVAIFGIPLGALVLFGMIALGMWGCPTYNVWQQGLAGEAELARAQQNRQIAIQEAMAKKESAKLLGEAEVARAHGVAEANGIIANGLGGPEGYLRYLYIHMLENTKDKQVIYLPTEAGLPILEAGRLTALPIMPAAVE